MAQKKRTSDIVGMWALLIIILIPVGFFAYAKWSPDVSPAAGASTPTAPTAPANTVIPATIALDDPSELPQSVVTAELVPFSFTIQNTSDQNGTVPYKVYVKWSTGEEDVIDENVLSLAGGASSTINEQLKFEIATETADVYLELTQSGQTSQFTLPRQ